jgi:hypothetical protein
MNRSTLSLVGTALVLLLQGPVLANTKVYACKDQNGRNSYSQVPCAGTSQSLGSRTFKAESPEPAVTRVQAPPTDASQGIKEADSASRGGSSRASSITPS